MVHREGVALDIDRAPVAGAMALRALPAPVAGRPGVARRAIGLARVIEIGGFPGAGAVAGRTLSGKVVNGFVLGVARLAVGLA